MILFQVTKDFKKPVLLYIAKNSNLKKYSKLTKSGLIELINTHYASRFCARLYLKKCKRNKVYINTTDPITLGDLKYPYFEIEVTPGKLYRYNMTSFYSYMVKTGNFKDPYTDTNFTNSQLKLMDRQLKKCGYMKQSLFTIKNNPNKQSYYDRQIERENCLLGMDRQIGDLLTEVCDDLFEKLDNGDNVEHTCYHSLIHIFLPNFVYLLEQLKNIDINYTRKCLKDYISWVKHQNVPLGNIITNLLKNELYCIS